MGKWIFPDRYDTIWQWVQWDVPIVSFTPRHSSYGTPTQHFALLYILPSKPEISPGGWFIFRHQICQTRLSHLKGCLWLGGFSCQSKGKVKWGFWLAGCNSILRASVKKDVCDWLCCTCGEGWGKSVLLISLPFRILTSCMFISRYIMIYRALIKIRVEP